MTNKEIISFFEPGFKVIAKENLNTTYYHLTKGAEYEIVEIIWRKNGIHFFITGFGHMEVYGTEVFDLEASSKLNYHKLFYNKMDDILKD